MKSNLVALGIALLISALLEYLKLPISAAIIFMAGISYGVKFVNRG